MHVIDISFESTTTLTQPEFFEWVQARERAGDIHHYELLSGRVVMTPPAGHPHGEVELELHALVREANRNDGFGRAFGSSQGFELPSGDTVQPDCAVVSHARWDAMGAPQDGKFLPVVPDVVFEIFSKSTSVRDRGEKKAIYQANGVREYWLIDPRARTVTVFVLDAAAFDAGTTATDPERCQSRVLASLNVDVAALLGGAR